MNKETKQDKIMERFIANAKQETLEEAAEKWVFKTNSHKWSNNDDTAGDNHGSFKEGAKWQEKQIGKSEFLQRLRATKSDAEARRLIFETFKKK